MRARTRCPAAPDRQLTSAGVLAGVGTRRLTPAHVRAGASSKRTAGRCPKWAVNNLKDHVRDLGTAAYAQQVLNSPKQSILKLIKRLTEEDGGIEFRSSNAFWWHPALSPLAMYHAMLARAHRLQTRCREARLRSAAAPKISTACPLCKARVDDEDHAVGGTCTGENVINLIRERHDHAVRSIWSAVRAGDLGGFPMWTDVETRSKTAIAMDQAATKFSASTRCPAQHTRHGYYGCLR